MKRTPLIIAVSIALSGLFIAGCDNKENDSEAAAQQQQMPPTVVNVMPVRFQSVPLVKEFSGRTSAYQVAEIRPQVTGVVEEILYQQGRAVNEGQPLYRINPENYQSSQYANHAALQQAQANVETAKASYNNALASIKSREAEYLQAVADLERIRPLLDLQAISEQQVQQAATRVKTAQAALESSKSAADQARANIGSAQAAVETAKAQLASSQLDISRTTVRAPISGVTERSNVTAGALVNANQAQPLVTISKINPIYVDISQSSSELLQLKKQQANGELQPGVNSVELVLEDGSTYPIRGQLALEEAKVDEDTGSVTLRAIFQNNSHTLLPGMYVQARLIQGLINNAVLLPQSALIRTPKGDTQVQIVNNDDTVETRDVTVNGTYEGNWIITDGLKAGENIVVVGGGSNINPEQKVISKPYQPPSGSSAQGSNQSRGPAQGPRAPKSQTPKAQGPVSPKNQGAANPKASQSANTDSAN